MRGEVNLGHDQAQSRIHPRTAIFKKRTLRGKKGGNSLSKFPAGKEPRGTTRRGKEEIVRPLIKRFASEGGRLTYPSNRGALESYGEGFGA